MQKIKIVTDSTIDMSKQLLEEWGVEIVPLTVLIDGENFIDNVTISPEQFMERMKVASELPKTSQPASGEFLEVYNRLGDEGFDVLSIHLTGGMSGTVGAASVAAAMSSADVTVVDSLFITQALGFQVIEAAKMAKNGKTMSEILARLDEIRANTKLYLVVDTLDNLVKGGRIGRGTALIGSLLNVKPIAAIADGVYTPVVKVRGLSKVVKKLTEMCIEDTKGKTIKGIAIAHADGMQLGKDLETSLKENISNLPTVNTVPTTPVISTHTGAGAIALMYYTD